MPETKDTFEPMLTGGHPNSLGNTLQIVEIVLQNSHRLEELYQCYFSEDEVVRLRTSSAIKRICKAHPEWLIPYLDRLLTEISQIEQPSTQWTLASLFEMLTNYLTIEQHKQATILLKYNLAHHTDWIVLNTTMQTLWNWSEKDPDLRVWLIPHLERLSQDSRKSVSSKAKKYLKEHKYV